VQLNYKNKSKNLKNCTEEFSSYSCWARRFHAEEWALIALLGISCWFYGAKDLVNKIYFLAPALGGTKFLSVRDIILATLCCAT
jgi:hypothetical protein